jgi:outer membrane lipoprotein carrier protein
MGRNVKLTGLLLVCGCLAPALASADAAAALRAFLDEAQTMSAAFRQTLISESGEAAQESTGRFYVKRPGRFRWDYETPAQQLVVSDGTSLWMYDADLEQVTVRAVDETLSGTPAMLLSGRGSLDDNFRIVETYERDGLGWVALEPLETSPEFEALRVALDGDSIARIEVVDSLGQLSRLEFSDFRRDPPLDDGLFRFEPPEGVDVIGPAAD